jgi:hypothetical protein
VRKCIGILLVAALLPACAFAEAGPIKNVNVYKEPGRFGGWPANNGIWCWDNEIVVGFTLGYFKLKPGHAIDPDKPSVRRLARSLDGGETWTIEVPSYLDAEGNEKEPTDCPGGFDFTGPGFALMVRMQGSNRGFSRFYCSDDRCKTWQGPYKLPDFGRAGLLARTNYIVEGKHEIMAFMTATKEAGGEGRPFCSRTTDGGKTWQFVSWIGPEPSTRPGYAIMPSGVRMSPTELLAMVRRKEAEGRRQDFWIEAFLSQDNGASWQLMDQPRIQNGGNPASMIVLKDGRIALTYGYRRPPYGIRARLSSDNGRTWTKDIILRDDGGNWDLGYPRTVQRADGKIVTVYYFNEAANKERYIAATIWDPGEGSGMAR